MWTLIQGGTLVNEGETFEGDILIREDRIERINAGRIEKVPENTRIIDATEQYVIPGVIDDQVHF